MPALETDFQWVPTPNPHLNRMQEILRNHPEIKGLFGPHPALALYATLLVLIQLVTAVYFSAWPWWVMLILAYIVGATINHALFVVIHECAHFLVFKSPTANRLLGIFVNFPIFFPSAIGFFKFHLLHHNHQGAYELDADLPSRWEARLAANSPWKKATLLFFYGFIQGFSHTHRLRNIRFFDFWFYLNVFLQIAFLALFFSLFGIWPLIYFMASTIFGLGLHPLGGRWIQEHYVLQGGNQETYSYYGPLNKICFNVGYHNEHHDFMKVPWLKLPRVKAIAPEYYDSLISYRSWSWVLWKFLFDPQITFFNRVLRRGAAA